MIALGKIQTDHFLAPPLMSLLNNVYMQMELRFNYGDSETINDQIFRSATVNLQMYLND